VFVIFVLNAFQGI